MKKKVLRERRRALKVVVLGTERPEIIPYDKGAFVFDKNGELKEVEVKPKRKRASKKKEA